MIEPLSPVRSAGVLQVYLLGTVDFEAALLLQKRLLYDISGDRSQAALIVCEHPPLITVGRRGSRAHILYEPDDLRTRRWPIRWVNRGGGCVLHHPGQLAVYPILPLDRLGFTVTGYLQLLGGALSDLLTEFHLSQPVQASPAGLFCGPRMVAALGVAVRDWVSYFGAYLNVQPPLDPFRKVLPPERIANEPPASSAGEPSASAGGELGSAPMTSLVRERRGPVRPSLVRERLVEHCQRRFGFERIALFSEHPFLARCTQPPARGLALARER